MHPHTCKLRICLMIHIMCTRANICMDNVHLESHPFNISILILNLNLIRRFHSEHSSPLSSPSWESISTSPLFSPSTWLNIHPNVDNNNSRHIQSCKPIFLALALDYGHIIIFMLNVHNCPFYCIVLSYIQYHMHAEDHVQLKGHRKYPPNAKFASCYYSLWSSSSQIMILVA